LLSGGFGAPPKLWDLRRPNPEPVKLQEGPAGFAIAFHPHKNLTAIGAIDGSVRIHDSENPTVPLHVLSIKKAQSVGATCSTAGSAPEPPVLKANALQLEVPVSSVSFHPTDADMLVATTNDGNVRVWNFAKGQAVCRLGIKSPGFTSATFNKAGNLIAITSEDGPMVWNLETDEVVTLRGHRRSTWMVDFRRIDGAHSENSLVSASSDSTRVWRMQAALRPMPLSQDEVDRVRGSVQVVDEPLQVYNKARREYVTFNVPPQSLAAVSEDGTRVLVARRNGAPNLGSLMLYDSANSSEPIAMFQTPITDWKSVGFLTNPDRIVAVSAAGVANSWLYFRTRELLTKFALEHLPLQDSQTVELSAEDQCRFGIRPIVSCQEAFALQETNRPGVF
jgi:WD40 repeat protein